MRGSLETANISPAHFLCIESCSYRQIGGRVFVVLVQWHFVCSSVLLCVFPGEMSFEDSRRIRALLTEEQVLYYVEQMCS